MRIASSFVVATPTTPRSLPPTIPGRSLRILFAMTVVGCAAYPSTDDEPPLGVAAQAQSCRHDRDDLHRPQKNSAGEAQSAHTTGVIDTTNPFFQSLGANGRTCDTCHAADQGWSITTKAIRQLYAKSNGRDVLFTAHDAANAPTADVSTPKARKAAFSQILSRGVIRIGRPVPSTGEFELVSADDPTGYSTADSLSLFRRPLPTSNLRFLSTISWDGRSNVPDDPGNIRLGLMNQANGASVNHAQLPATSPLPTATREAIADFELGLHFAQVEQHGAGALDRAGARGGIDAILAEPFTPGATSSPVFTLFDAWTNDRDPNRRAIADGQRVFNTKTFGPSGTATCAGCHNTPNNGGSATIRFFDIGVSDPARRKSDQILFTFRNKTTGEIKATLDPGRGLVTGAWADIGKFKVPSLRGLAARPPYFHDGSAETIEDVVDFYEKRFSIAFDRKEKSNLIKFLEAL
jgi:cytochrome c peroxidase